MRFQVLLSLWSVTSWLCIDEIPEVAKTKVSKPKRYSLSELRLYHAPLKRLIQTRPHMSTSWCGKICKTPPERRRNYYSRCSIVAAVSWRHGILRRTAHFTEDYFLNLGVACQLCSKAVSIKWGNSNFARTVYRFWLTACKYVFLFKEFATDDSNTSFEQCRVVLAVCRFSDHKCRHGNVYAARCNVISKNTV